MDLSRFDRAAGSSARRRGRPGVRTMARSVSVAVLLVAVGTGCAAEPARHSGSGGGTASTAAADTAVEGAALGSDPAATGVPAGSSEVATARLATVRVLSEPGGPLEHAMDNPTADGAPLTFRVLDRRPGWLHVQLPVRPNGSTGWVADGDVSLALTPYRLVVHRGSHRLEVQYQGRTRASYPVGIGTSVNPTPAGTYYLTELLTPPDPNGAYGPYAFGLSAFSTTLTSFAGGPGQLGLHGTNEPAKVGQDVSHGCLRVTNDVISRLAHEVPLGTPIEIAG